MTRPRPRLLFLGQTLPYPPDGGVNIRMYHTLRLLAREFDITALCFYRRQERSSPAAVARSVHALSRFARVEAFPIPQEYSLPRWVWDHLRSVANGRAYTWYAYDSDAVAHRIEQLRQEQVFDLAHIDSLDLAGYLPHLEGLPVAGAHHNVESVLLARRALRERAPWRRWYLAHQARLVERLERMTCPGLSLNVTVSIGDAMDLQRLAPEARFTVVPNGADTDAFRPAPPEGEEGVLGVGGLNWAPNHDALDLLCDEILPHLRRRMPGVSVRWVGRASDAQRDRYGRRYGVVLTGYVDDVRDHLARAACVVAPLRAGGGTRLKILDAWAMGKAVVTTSVGCEGLEAVDGVNLLIRDDPASFAEAVTRVLGDPVLRTRLGAGARHTVETTYAWEVVGAPMLREYLALCGRGAAAALAS
jgi:glycosyltransferase involved in cell wall biosynthesis